MTPEWLGSWWRAYGEGRTLAGLIFMDGRQRVAGIAPLYREERTSFPFRLRSVRMVGAGSGDSAALDFIIKPGAGKVVARAFLQWLSSRKTSWDVCSLETLAPASETRRCLLAALEHQRWPNMSTRSTHSFVDLPATGESYVQSLAPEFRPLLTRYAKRLETRYQVQIFRCDSLHDLASSLETLFALHQLRWTQRGQPGAFANPQRSSFYYHVADAFLRQGWLEFWLLALDGEIAAAQFCFRYRDTAYLLQEGFNPKYAADKVGYVLRAHVLQEMIRTGARRYDFLGGDDQHKLEFGAHPGQESYLDIHFAGASLPGRAFLAEQRRIRQAKRWLRDRLPERVLELLHVKTG
jgi:CelD/BcsL family acetyltransferase involved in cellulose biosynthesis